MPRRQASPWRDVLRSWLPLLLLLRPIAPRLELLLLLLQPLWLPLLPHLLPTSPLPLHL